MPYIGRDLNRGNYLKLDDISSSFNSSTTTFNLTVGGSAFTPGSAFSILVSVGGVIQEPESAYQVNNSEITFANPPTAQDSFFCIALGVALGIGVPGSGTVNGPQMAKPFNYNGFFYLDDANNRVGIGSLQPKQALDIIGNTNITGILTAGTYSGPVSNASGISTFYDLRVSNNLTVEGTTTTLDTNLIGVDRIEVGANSNSVVGVAITQSGTADILNLYDGSNKEFSVTDGGTVYVSQSMAFQQSDRATTAGLLGRGSLLLAGTQQTDFAIRSAPHNSNLVLGVGVTERLRISSNGQTTIKSTANQPLVLNNTNTNGQSSISFQSAGSTKYNLGSNKDNDGNIDFFIYDQVNNKHRFNIKADGNIGVGTDNPLTELHVHGETFTDLTIHSQRTSGNIGGLNFRKGGVSSGIMTAQYIVDVDGNHFFYSQGSQRLRISSDGDLTISGSDNAELKVKCGTSTGNNILAFINSAGSTKGRILYDSDNNFMAFSTNGTASSNERLRIASDGRVYIGNTQDSSPYAWNLGLQVSGTSTNAGLSLRRDQSGSGGALLMFVKTGGAKNGNTAPSDGDQIGGIYFNAADGTDVNNVAARISGTIDGTPGSNDTPGRLTFATTADGANSPTERLRIQSNGYVNIGSGTAEEQLTIRNTTQHCLVRIISKNNSSAGVDFGDPEDTDIGRVRYYHSDGTNTNYMRFDTNGGEKLRIDSSGNVGINQSSPRAKLDVTGYIYSSNGSQIQITGSPGAKGLQLIGQDDGTSLIGTMGSSGEHLLFRTASNERMRLLVGGPHLLIGGTSGLNEITESASNSGLVIGNTSMGNGGLAIINSTTGTGRIYFGDAVGSNAARNRGQINYYHNGDYMLFATAGSPRLRISSNGDVIWNNVGTATPGHGNNTVGMGFEPRNGTIFLSRSDNATIFSNRNGDGAQFILKRDGTDKFHFGLQNSGADFVLHSGSAAGGTERLRIKGSNGYIGVNNDNPQRVLHVGKSGTAEANIRLQGGSDTFEFRVKDSDDCLSGHINIGGSTSLNVFNMYQSREVRFPGHVVCQTLGSGTSSQQASFGATQSGMSATSYNYILSGSNDVGNKCVLFVNGSSRSADGGANTLTLRNDGGELVLGNTASLTHLPGLTEGTIRARTLVTSYQDSITNTGGCLTGGANDRDAWIFNWYDSASWGIYNRNIDTTLTVNGFGLPSNSTAFIGGGNLKAYINHNNGEICASGGFLIDGESTTTNQAKGIRWTAFDKENTNDRSDIAGIIHTINQEGIAGAVLRIYSDNDDNDGVVIKGGNSTSAYGTRIVNGLQVRSGGLRPTPGTGENGIKWAPDPYGGSGDVAHIQFHQDGSGENTELRIQCENDADDDIFITAPTVNVSGTFNKPGGSFRIPHVLAGLTTTTDLVHSFIEGPQADNLYRGRTTLVAGISTVNIDTTNNMTEGTFVNLNRDVQCFTSNETGWTAVKGSVTGNLLTIVAQDNTCTDTISWMVVGERWDLHMYDPRNPMTDENGKVRTEVPNRNYNKGGGFDKNYINENKLRVGISTISRPSIENKEVE